MRLNRFLAAAGFGSRRACDALIESGAVKINGRVVEKLATQVAEDDDVRVRGRQARVAKKITVIFHKPRGVVVTRADEKGRETVFDYLPPEYANLFHVGRLDKESEGLLLLTNDGDLAQRLTHPSHQIEKEYEVTINRPFQEDHAAKLLRGFYIEGGRAKFERLRAIAPLKLRVVLEQGLKRQIRLMLYQTGYEVERLVRVRIAGINGKGLGVGGYRPITERELESLVAKSPAKSPAAPSGSRGSAALPSASHRPRSAADRRRPASKT